MFILVTIGRFYIASENHEKIKTVQTLTATHFLMSVKVSNCIKKQREKHPNTEVVKDVMADIELEGG